MMFRGVLGHVDIGLKLVDVDKKAKMRKTFVKSRDSSVTARPIAIYKGFAHDPKSDCYLQGFRGIYPTHPRSNFPEHLTGGFQFKSTFC